MRSSRTGGRFSQPTVSFFLGAMFGVVFSEQLDLALFFWEVTTLCSFLLIGYKTERRIDRERVARADVQPDRRVGFRDRDRVVFPAQRQHRADHTDAGCARRGARCRRRCWRSPAITKSAQFPFTGWLLGAMVAPTAGLGPCSTRPRW